MRNTHKVSDEIWWNFLCATTWFLILCESFFYVKMTPQHSRLASLLGKTRQKGKSMDKFSQNSGKFSLKRRDLYLEFPLPLEISENWGKTWKWKWEKKMREKCGKERIFHKFHVFYLLLEWPWNFHVLIGSFLLYLIDSLSSL